MFLNQKPKPPTRQAFKRFRTQLRYFIFAGVTIRLLPYVGSLIENTIQSIVDKFSNTILPSTGFAFCIHIFLDFIFFTFQS